MTFMELLPIVDSEKVDLLYPSSSMKVARGSSVLLSCDAIYDPAQCEDVHVAWFQDATELTMPHKYITAVNESLISGPVKKCRRQVVTEILNLQSKDADRFQCKALCVRELSAMGHFISITITGDLQSVRKHLEMFWSYGRESRLGMLPTANSKFVFVSSSSLVG